LSTELSWWDAAVQVGSTSAPILVEPDGVRTFEDRVLYLSVHAPWLVELRDRLLAAITPGAASALVDDERPFVPHLTLITARRGRPLPSPRTIEPLIAHLEPFRASELTLYRRDLAAHGYRAWRRIALGAA
jgi:2'-5' RNA ligase